ncbi:MULTISPECIES: hypothetical protein [Lactococcus]|nr:MULTISPECIES: hypothetical protein [Lactococcus]MDT2727179.1 hypothetical protein [Lactococcus formosensis]
MNKKLLLTSFLTLGVIGAGTVTYGSLTSMHKLNKRYLPQNFLRV